VDDKIYPSLQQNSFSIIARSVMPSTSNAARPPTAPLKPRPGRACGSVWPKNGTKSQNSAPGRPAACLKRL